jgi:hypothetical protein
MKTTTEKDSQRQTFKEQEKIIRRPCVFIDYNKND